MLCWRAVQSLGDFGYVGNEPGRNNALLIDFAKWAGDQGALVVTRTYNEETIARPAPPTFFPTFLSHCPTNSNQ
jgi:hypothetical protein